MRRVVVDVRGCEKLLWQVRRIEWRGRDSGAVLLRLASRLPNKEI